VDPSVIEPLLLSESTLADQPPLRICVIAALKRL
jgi:hypothetical protein